MRLLLFSDLHRNTKAARDLVDMSGEVDVVIGAGDFATMRKGIQEVIDVLAEIDRTAVLVPGNGESFEEPLSTCGLCLATGAFDGAFGAFVLFFANFIAILLVALVMFTVAGMAPAPRWNSLGDFFRRFGLAATGFMLIAVVLTHSLMRIYWDRWSASTIESVLITELADESVALDDVQYKALGETVYVMATVRSPRIIAPGRVTAVQQKLRDKLSKPTELVVRTMVAEDVAAVGSNISTSEMNLNGVFFSKQVSEREAHKRLARQVLLENLSEQQGYRLTNLEYGHASRGSVVYAFIDTIHPLNQNDIRTVEMQLQERLDDPDIALVVQYNRSTVIERNGRMLIEWTKYGDNVDRDTSAVQDLRNLILVEAQKLPNVIPLAVHFHIDDGVWRTLLEVVGPRPVNPAEVVLLQKVVSTQFAHPVEINLWHRTDVVVTSDGYVAFEDFTQETLQQRVESLPRIFHDVATR